MVEYLSACKDVLVHLGDEGPVFHDLGVQEGRGRETSDVAETQPDMTRCFGPGERVAKGGVHQEKRQGENFNVLLLFAKYIRPAFGVGRGKCGAVPIRGVLGGGREGRPEPKKGIWSCQYIGGLLGQQASLAG